MPINSFLYPGVRIPPVFEVANSVRLDDGSSDNFSKTNTSGNSDTTKFTVSLWFKKTAFESNGGGLFMIKNASNNTADKVMLYFLDDKLNCFISDSGGSTESNVVPNRLFRDSSAWTHLTYRYDSTQGTDSNRVRIYINGTQETSLGTANYPDQNHAQPIDDSTQTIIGKSVYSNGNTYYFDGYMCEAVLVNGQSLDPTSFGKFDEDSPTIWKPIDVSGLTFGNDGFYLDFEDSSNLGNDVSGGTDFTENNLTSIDQSTDTCTNNFATLNPLYKQVHTFSEGNLEYTSSTTNYDSGLSTIGVSNGKWYWETKLSSLDGSTFRFYMGICDERDGNIIAEDKVGQDPSGRVGDTIGLIPDGSSPDAVKNGSSTGSWTSNSVNDIIGVAVDCDNGAVYFSKNGTFMNSGDPTSGATKTGGITFTTGETYLMGVTVYGSSSAQQQVNFGNPVYSVSSPQSDANGFGSFSYAPPSGYLSLCSKNLGSDGG